MFEQQKQSEENTLKGVELLEKKHGYERYRLPSGMYLFDFGFRNFGEHESDWFSGGSSRESDRQMPFIFDYDRPEVKQFALSLFGQKRDFNHPKEVLELIERFNRLIESMDISESEYNNSLSDIIISGRGMCDSKSTLLGSIITRNTNLEAQAIIGQYGCVRDKVSYSFSHQWMRITDGKNVYLVDPMYEKFAVFVQEEDSFYSMDEEDSYFSNLTPACYPAAELIVRMDIERYGKVNTVESFDNHSAEVYVNNQDSLFSQVSNQMSFVFTIDKPQELKIYEGAIKNHNGTTSLYSPIKKFVKIDD